MIHVECYAESLHRRKHYEKSEGYRKFLGKILEVDSEIEVITDWIKDAM